MARKGKFRTRRTRKNKFRTRMMTMKMTTMKVMRRTPPEPAQPTYSGETHSHSRVASPIRGDKGSLSDLCGAMAVSRGHGRVGSQRHASDRGMSESRPEGVSGMAEAGELGRISMLLGVWIAAKFL